MPSLCRNSNWKKLSKLNSHKNYKHSKSFNQSASDCKIFKYDSKINRKNDYCSNGIIEDFAGKMKNLGIIIPKFERANSAFRNDKKFGKCDNSREFKTPVKTLHANINQELNNSFSPNFQVINSQLNNSKNTSPNNNYTKNCT